MQSFRQGRASTPQPTPAPLKLGVGPESDPEGSRFGGDSGGHGDDNGRGNVATTMSMPSDNINAVTVYLNPNPTTSGLIADSAPISPATVPPPAASAFPPAAETPAQPQEQTPAAASASASASAVPIEPGVSRKPTHQSSFSNATSASASQTTFNIAHDHSQFQQQLGAPNELDTAIRQLLEQQADIQARLNVLLAHQHGFDPAHELSMLQHKYQTLERLVHHHGKHTP